MAPLLEKLPTILVLAVLVGIFISLRKHSPSAQVRLWIFAWALIFVHFFVQLFETGTGKLVNLCHSIDLAALELSGIVFLVSLTTFAENRARRWALLALLGLPTLFHAVAVSFDWRLRWTLAAALAAVFFGGAAFPFALRRKFSWFQCGISALAAGVGCWSVYAQLRGNSDLGVTAILGLSFGLCGVLFWRRFPRFSPGVVTVAGGFLAWGAVFPVGALVYYFHPNAQVNPAIWNVPKFFVAVGMILSVLEDKSRIVEETSAREHTENAFLQRFSRITSQLLTRKDPAALCGEIAESITETASFRRAAILLAHDDGSLFLAGTSGFSLAETETLVKLVRQCTAARIQELCAVGARLGHNSLWLGQPGLLRSARLAEAPSDLRNAGQEVEDEVVVPLVSYRGSNLGWIVLAEPRSDASVSEIVKLEMLAADLAVTIENARLHHQLVRSEKLAALGQLVAGVAHELNNPLTGVLGYLELLSEEVKNEGARRRLGKLGHEARRMQRIVDGLLRFARQNNPRERSTNFEAALRDAVMLREYHLRARNVQVETAIEPLLPPLAIGEDELKQVLLNLLNNAVDAVEESRERSIRIHAARRGEHVEIRFEDSGPGFSDLNRAFDPFFTTKPVGKGTGLGLSICYGIIREAGGEILLSNKQPYGASVVVELPIAYQPALPLRA